MLYIFPDTNALLHFKRPDQIDWPSALDCKLVTIVIAPVIIRELEQQKVQNPVRKLRERAQGILRWLAGFIEAVGAVEIRQGVLLHFIQTSPLLDFAAHRLVHFLSDDELIASVIEFRINHAEPVKIMTADLGMRLKLRAHDIESFIPPDTDQLPDQPDEAEKVIAELRREIARYQNRRPKLVVTFADGADFAKLSMMRPKPAQAQGRIYPGLSDYQFGAPSEEAYAQYYRQLAQWNATVELLCSCQLHIANEGTAEATDIVADFSLPDFITAIRDDDLPDEPRPPPSIFEPSHLLNVARLTSYVGPRSPARPYVSDTGKLSFRIPTLVHNRTIVLDQFFFRFSKREDIQNFSLRFALTYRETLDPIEGQLNVVVNR